MHSKTWAALVTAFWLSEFNTLGSRWKRASAARPTGRQNSNSEKIRRMTWRRFVGTMLICLLGGHAAIADDDWSTEAGRYVWMRKDGQRITGNARREKQISDDKQTCLELLRESVSIVPDKNGSSMVRGCLTAKGYILIPADEMEKRLAEAASTSIKRQTVTGKSAATTQQRMQNNNSDPNKTNQLLMALAEKDRRAFFTTIILAEALQCGEVTRTFYRGSARPSYNAVWNIGCSKGPSYSILIMSDEKGSSKIMTCGELRAIGGGECFVKP
jgi:hypothetical protein